MMGVEHPLCKCKCGVIMTAMFHRSDSGESSHVDLVRWLGGPGNRTGFRSISIHLNTEGRK